MSNNSTFLTYICSKSEDKLTQFIWSLPYKIEIKSIEYKKGKWFCWFNHSSSRDPLKTKVKNIDLDKIA